MRRTELRGREQELELLFQAVDDTRAGSGTTVLLEGEAGIGKTRLIDEVAARAESVATRVCRGAAEELEQDRSFGALLEALGAPDVLPSAGGHAGGSEEARFVVQDAFVDRVEDLADAPLLLALDDLQVEPFEHRYFDGRPVVDLRYAFKANDRSSLFHLDSSDRSGE